MSSTPRKRKQVATSPVSSPTSQNGRVFTDSDEIRLLKIFKKLAEQNPSSSSSSTPNSTITIDSSSFNRINSSLGSKFTHAQITDKIRRLRVKYHKQARSKSLIKTPHDQALFKIAQLIWGKKKTNRKKEAKKVQNSASADDEDEGEEQKNEQNEEREREGAELDEYPVLAGELSKYLPMNLVWREALKSLGNDKLKEMNDKWMLIGIEEAKIVSKKADLVKEQTQLIMKALGDGTANGNEYAGFLWFSFWVCSVDLYFYWHCSFCTFVAAEIKLLTC